MPQRTMYAPSVLGIVRSHTLFADHIDGITGEEDELTKLVQNLDTTANKFFMEQMLKEPR